MTSLSFAKPLLENVRMSFPIREITPKDYSVLVSSKFGGERERIAREINEKRWKR